MRETMRMMAGAALLLVASSGNGGLAQGPAAAPSQRLPIPPPLPPPPSGASSTTACSQQDAKAKAERLLDLLRFLIVRDPNQAKILLNEFQGAVQRSEDGSADIAATCRSYDELIARATE